MLEFVYILIYELHRYFSNDVVHKPLSALLIKGENAL